jgi:multidrug efflux pump subunit AcrA (membrane-fusion protein)
MTISRHLLTILCVKKLQPLIERPVPLTSQKGGFLLQKRNIWLAALLGVIILLAGYFSYSKVFTTSKNTIESQSQTAVVRPGDLTVSASGSGTLIAQNDASFGFDTSGQVTGVYVKVGGQVEAGQVLAQLDNTLAKLKYDEPQRKLQELYSAAFQNRFWRRQQIRSRERRSQISMLLQSDKIYICE